MMPDLTARAVGARELMDHPDADERMLARTYALFPLVNAVVSGRGGLSLRELRRRAPGGVLRVLDIGTGGGDRARALARRLRRAGCAAEITAIDVDARAIAWASARDGGAGIRWRCASTAELVGTGERFDLVISNHVLHHLTAAELADVLRDSLRLTAQGGAIVHSDIARSRLAYALFAAATLPLAGTLLAGSFIRPDGLTSIRRSYTADELATAAGPGWRVERRPPSRLLLRAEAVDDGP